MINLLTGDRWIAVKDGDPRALALFKRHYSYRQYADGRQPKLFVGPGQKLVLMTQYCDALFIWRKFRSMDHQEGVNCAVYRREPSCEYTGSELLLEAMQHALRKWGGCRLYTYINPALVQPKYVRSAPVWDWLWRKCGWRECGVTKVNKLLIFEYIPE